MVIDLGNGEAIRARHEVDLHRILEARVLMAQACQARRSRTTSRGWWSDYWNRLLCELDAQRFLLVERLAHLELDPALLRGGDPPVLRGWYEWPLFETPVNWAVMQQV
jgi:hypothetical protein